jgi:ribA/ribD-fused uncharacterized protein
METDTEIYFYNLQNKFAYMSNFYKASFIDTNGIKFNCSEQYFMYYKCKLFDPNNTALLKAILAETSATKIKQYGRQVSHFNETIWNNAKYDIMYDALRLKFTQNEDIYKKLLSTQGKILYEASKNDKIWGIGYYDKDAINVDKSKFGQNLLGKALMELRNNL